MSTNDNAIGRRFGCAQDIVCACIRFFDSFELDRLTCSLKAMAQDFDLGSYVGTKKISAPKSLEQNPKQESEPQEETVIRARGWGY